MKPSIIERFWSRVDKGGPNGCWLWTAGKYTRGYGAFWDGTKQGYAHRISFSLIIGDIPPGIGIDHICHNHACVNPAHLRLATNWQNMWNTGKPRTNTSGYKGVTFRGKYWCAQIRVCGKRFIQDGFLTAEAAYEWYCEMARKYHGEFVNLGDTYLNC